MEQRLQLQKPLLDQKSNFVKMMTEKANELGLKDFKFVNSTGLNNRDLINHMTMVRN